MNLKVPIFLMVAFGLCALVSAAAENPCAACHDEISAKFAGSAHGKAFLHDEEYSEASCVSCHGSGAEHMESGDPAQILQPAKASADKANEACLSCHSNDETRAHWRGSVHEAAGLKCAQCHSVHGSGPSHGKMVYETVNDLCVSCHTSQKMSMTQRSTHPLLSGKLDCASCHNPHGTGAEHNLKADSVNDLCYSCHQEKRGPFLWEHSPVREDCMTCHKSHGSNNDKLLVARPAQLCQSCHLQGRHQTVAGLSTAMWNVNRACLNCHAQIHGSNHPSGPLFQR
jgi:DmsE family decaheme c-type cytochrome